MAAPKTPRPADELAREIVPDPIMRDDRGHILAEMRYPGQTTGAVWPDFARVEEVDDLRRLIAHTIISAREEGAAAERVRQEPASDTAHDADKFRAVVLAARDVCLVHDWDMNPPGPHERRLADAIADSGIAHEPTDRTGAQQPRDLAGRIRDLIDLHVTRWLEASGDDATVLRIVVERLREAHDCVRQGRSIGPIIDEFRRRYRPWASIVDRAADELETIVRESGER